jgi:hypothetical protein
MRSIGKLTTWLLVMTLAALLESSKGDLVAWESDTDGNGLFSYTCTKGDEPFLFGLEDGSGGIAIKSYGVLEVYNPPGWTSETGTNGYISWSYTNQGIWFIEDIPVTFSVLSSYTNTILYDRPLSDPSYSRGIVFGGVYTTNHTGAAGGSVPVGFESFSFLGPAIPEPSTGALLLIALIVCKGISRAKFR